MGVNCCGGSEDLTHAKSKAQRADEEKEKGILARNSVKSQQTNNETPGQPEPS